MCFSRRRVISYFDAPPSHLYGSKQPLRRDLSNGRRTPHVAHKLVKQSFLNEGSVLETNGEVFCKSEQICGSTSVRQQNKYLFKILSVVTLVCNVSYSHSARTMVAPTSMRLTAMVLQKLLTSVSLHGRVETAPKYCCFSLCSPNTNALFNHITYKNCLLDVFFA